MQILFALFTFLSVVLDKALGADEAAPSFKDQCMKWHNEYRKKHQVDSVKWSDTLAKGAQDWADYLAQNNKFEHAKNAGAGENIYWSSSAKAKEPCTEATQLFYGEVKDYDFSKPGFSGKTGHFTQVVWKSTKEIGAAKAIRKDGSLIVVIRYSPAGNFASAKAFRENVLPMKGQDGVGPVRSSLAFIGFVVATGIAVKSFF
ncbi:hypothetical protein OS493_032568 [Desmophyllum pertusum]|uniref:SCP domain-containing protein n=1 Tax=Desmophyllum pertusum TaxID=174260 RepID=A0A9X0CPA4_9CNID|nr:hypothetical protein OS493_032568 [Desmophyllum pertusum]